MENEFSLGGLGDAARRWAEGQAAQQVTAATPQTTVSDSFLEHTGPAGTAGQELVFPVRPAGQPQRSRPLRCFDPSAGASSGSVLRRGFNGGSRQLLPRFPSHVHEHHANGDRAQNGVPGYARDASVSPFVMGYVPVVGGFPTLGAFQPAMPQPSVVTGHPAVVDGFSGCPTTR